jgi:hypothetical protein
MKETIKNFLAMVVATVIWCLAFSILVGIYFLIESGLSIEEGLFLVVVITLFTVGVFAAQKNERLKAALNFPLFPGA